MTTTFFFLFGLIARPHTPASGLSPRPTTSLTDCRFGSRPTVRALLCAPSASLSFRFSYFRCPSRRSFVRANSTSFKSSKMEVAWLRTTPRNPNDQLSLCWVRHPAFTRNQLDVITAQRRQSSVAQLIAMAVHADLSVQIAFVDASSVTAEHTSLKAVQKKERKDGNITSGSSVAQKEDLRGQYRPFRTSFLGF